MPRKTLLASALAMLIAGAATVAIAQDNPSAPTTTGTAARATAGARPPFSMRGARDMGGPNERRGHHMRGHDNGAGSGGVIADLHALERLYLQSGRSKELPALYKEVLAKSQDPRAREYAYHHLARAQMRPTHVDEAIATLRKSLDENLANEARRRAERAQMRAHWQQRSGTAAPAVK